MEFVFRNKYFLQLDDRAAAKERIAFMKEETSPVNTGKTINPMDFYRVTSV